MRHRGNGSGNGSKVPVFYASAIKGFGMVQLRYRKAPQKCDYLPLLTYYIEGIKSSGQ